MTTRVTIDVPKGADYQVEVVINDTRGNHYDYVQPGELWYVYIRSGLTIQRIEEVPLES